MSTEFNLATNELENNGTIPSISPVAQLRGGLPLEPEESTNYSAGVILEFAGLAITVDYFNIELEDRLAISQNFVLTPAEIGPARRERALTWSPPTPWSPGSV